jgi:hypothetical protein
MSLLRVLTIRSPPVRSSIALADAVSPWTGLPMGMKGSVKLMGVDYLCGSSVVILIT